MFSTVLREMREARWSEVLNRGLKLLNKSSADVRSDRKSAPWKVALAGRIKEKTQASNGWIAENLQMGTPVAVSTHVGRLKRGQLPAATALVRQLLPTHDLFLPARWFDPE